MEYGKFYIFVRSPVTCSAARKQVSGYIDDNGIGYMQNGKGYWSAVDIASGLCVAKKYDTLDECVENVNNLFEKIKKMRKKDGYKDDVEWFNSSPIENIEKEKI